MNVKTQDLVEKFSKKLREIREAKGLTQAACASLAGLGEEPYARLERGSTLPRFETFLSLVKALNVKSDDLLTFEGETVLPETADGPSAVTTAPESADLRRLLRSSRKLGPRELNLVAQLAETLVRKAKEKEGEEELGEK